MSVTSTWPGRGVIGAGVLLLLIGATTEAARSRKELQESENRLRRDVTYLASDECEGRGPTTKGIDRAAAYIADQFKLAGLRPGFRNGWFQPFAITAAEARLTLTGPRGQQIELKQRIHFNPLGYDQAGTIVGPAVFAGYGITAKDPPYDDYTELNVENKVVVVLRDTPRADGQRSKEMFTGASLLNKVTNAQKHRAAALLIVNDADTAQDGDSPMDYSYVPLSRGAKRIPAFMLRRSVLEAMLPTGTTLRDIEKGIDRDMKPSSFPLTGWTVSLDVSRKPDHLPLKNVVGILDGQGPLARETIVVGAHYDHLGFGSPSSLEKGKRRAIHHGADDNASGTTSLIELARRFAAMPNPQGRRLVFIAFSGEELGLFGSRHYCKEPIFPLEKTAAMFNLDMVGRLRNDTKTGKPRLLTEGHGTAQPFKELITNLSKKHDFTLVSKESGFGPSDHASFCGKKVPVLFFWTGTHPEYHRPTDTADRINVTGMRRIVDMSEEAVLALTRMEKPAFVEVKGSGVARPSSGPRLGIRPGYGGDAEGVEVEGVVAGGPAEKGGLKEGDRIVGIAGLPVKDLRTYMQAMATQKKGNTIEVIVIRKTQKVPLKVPLE